MAFDPAALQSIERKRYVLEHAPAILCALIVRRVSTDPSALIDDAIETANILFDKIDPPRPVPESLSARPAGVSGTA